MIAIAVVTLFIITTSCKATSEFCSPEFSNKCFCGLEEYLNKQYYIVNCTDTGFTRADMLQHLPPQTEVLLFTGNNVTELPLNIFGTQNNSKLRIIDMSNNHIKIIRGKSFHHVSNVERLILNHNEISISSDDPAFHHPRIFSNFENLIELHLTDAFADNSPEGLAADLHDIFVSSDLSLLRKLHLEQNEISQFQDSRVFCDLPSLQDLHLGQNALQGIHVELSCLKHLRFLDLQANFMYSLNGEELSQLDIFPARNQSLTIDLSNNPLTCNCDELYSWLRDTKVEVRNKNKLHCRRSLQDISPHCTPKLLLKPLVLEPVNNNLFLISVLFIILCISVFLNIYTNREFLRHTFTPALQAVTKKVHYTTIGKPEDPEMDV